MAYKRKATRAPRALEETAALRERDEALSRVNTLTARNTELRDVVQQLRDALRIRDFETEKLLHDKVALAIELRNARITINFLEGREGPGAVWVIKTKWNRSN